VYVSVVLSVEIITLVEEWERAHFPPSDAYPSKGEAIKYSTVVSAGGQSACDILAEKLVRTAREFSLDSNKDSPFAVLAKENDIMWGGGMPDDTTVAVLRVMKGEVAVEK
jgi:protein phosphatase PTC7